MSGPRRKPGTHRGRNKMFPTAPRTPFSASVFLLFVRVTFSHPAFTAVTRVQISVGDTEENRIAALLDSRWLQGTERNGIWVH